MIFLIQSAYIDENDNFHKALKSRESDKRVDGFLIENIK